MNHEKVRKKDSARLVWDSKPRRAPNPKDIEFQTAEIVIPNPQYKDKLPLSFRDGLFGEKEIDKQKMNRLIWGDNLLAMQALLSQGYEGKINLIYIDPPFDSKADYSHKMVIEGNEFTKEPSIIERLAYKDTWAGGTDSYLDMLYPRLQLMKRLLAEDAAIYMHIGWYVSHYVKIITDEVFGKDNFRNEIVVRRIRKNVREREKVKALNFGHDVILFYAKSEKHLIIPPTRKVNRDERWHALDAAGLRTGMDYELFGVKPPTGRHWAWSKEKAEEAIKKGMLKPNPRTGRPEYLIPASDEDLRDTIWDDITAYSFKTGYDTEKKEDFLDLIVNASSNVGDLVADFFCGSGTTLAVAEKLNRRWIGCELGKVGIQVTRARLVEQQARPFLIENIGNYQREMIYLSGGRIWEMQQLILKLYGATPRDKLSGLGIRKTEDGTEELVYVGYPDRPVSAGKAEELALQAQKLDGRGYKRLIILGWDYEYNYHQALESRMKSVGAHGNAPKIEIISRDIPPDIYDYLKKTKHVPAGFKQGTEEDIEALSDKVKFYERPYLKMDAPKIKDLKDSKVEVILSIKRYVLMDIPISQTTKKGQEDYTALMKIAKDNFAVLIDYWAIDWDYDGFTFKSQWQAFRGNGKKAKTVTTEAKEILEKPAPARGKQGKKRTIAIRVVDIFGNDAGVVVEIGG
ncbi:MAG TPA: site-specific DNA-methyltransferase [Candidatus Brocadiaceae bacterium]|nr:site-specific DNA-methyltransferase [Candidatus Brocadiaceae bacterium]